RIIGSYRLNQEQVMTEKPRRDFEGSRLRSSQQPGPRLTRWKIRYDSFPEKGQKKKSELPLRRGIPGTSKRP
ncbi:hypothetical protein GBF38_009052, partial [Nibea albiflora]